MELPDCPYFTALCRVHTEEGNYPRRWEGASKWIPHTGGGGSLPNGSFWAPGCPLAGGGWGMINFCNKNVHPNAAIPTQRRSDARRDGLSPTVKCNQFLLPSPGNAVIGKGRTAHYSDCR